MKLTHYPQLGSEEQASTPFSCPQPHHAGEPCAGAPQQNASAERAQSSRAYLARAVGLADGSGFELMPFGVGPTRFSTVAKNSKNTAVQCGPMFNTMP